MHNLLLHRLTILSPLVPSVLGFICGDRARRLFPSNCESGER